MVRGGQVAWRAGGVACIIRVVEHSRALKFTSFLAKTFSNFFKHPASRMYVRAVAWADEGRRQGREKEEEASATTTQKVLGQ